MTSETDSNEERSKHTDERKLTASGIDRRSVLRSGSVLLGGTVLAGCIGGGGSSGNGGGGGNGSGGGGSGGNASGGGGSTTNIAIISSPAGFGDKAFNDLAWQGLQNAAEEFYIELQQVEETDQSNYGTVQSRLAESQNPDYDLVVLVGYNHTQALESNAQQYPDQKWMLINDYVDQPNVAGYAWANSTLR